MTVLIHAFITPTSPCAMRLRTLHHRRAPNLKLFCLQAIEENYPRISRNGSCRTKNSGPFMTISITRTHDFARSWVRCVQSTGMQVFLVDKFKLMPVKWSFPLRFYDSTVYALVTFPVFYTFCPHHTPWCNPSNAIILRGIKYNSAPSYVMLSMVPFFPPSEIQIFSTQFYYARSQRGRKGITILRSALFCDITQRTMLIYHRHFGKPSGPILRIIDIKDGADTLFRNVCKEYHRTLHNIQESADLI